MHNQQPQSSGGSYWDADYQRGQQDEYYEPPHQMHNHQRFDQPQYGGGYGQPLQHHPGSQGHHASQGYHDDEQGGSRQPPGPLKLGGNFRDEPQYVQQYKREADDGQPQDLVVEQAQAISALLKTRFGQAPPKEFGDLSKLQKDVRDRALLQNPDNLSVFDRQLMGQSMAQPDESMDTEEAPEPEEPAEPEKSDPNNKEWLEGPKKFVPTTTPGYALALFDKAYENSIWDYDTKFAWDYLPDTRRGTDHRAMKNQGFVMNATYIREEHKWKIEEDEYNKLWRDTYVPKVRALQQEGNDEVLDIRHVVASQQPADQAIAWFEENLGVPEDLCSTQYCGICEIEFKSVMPSVRHYLGPPVGGKALNQHDYNVKQYYIDSMCDGGHLSYDDLDAVHSVAILNRMHRIYRTRPKEWKCVICSAVLIAMDGAENHFKGSNHQKKLKALMDAKSMLTNPVKRKTATQRLQEQLKRGSFRGRGGRGGFGSDRRVGNSMGNRVANRGGFGSQSRGGATVVVPGELARGNQHHSVHQPQQLHYVDERQSGPTGTVNKKNMYGVFSVTTTRAVTTHGPAASATQDPDKLHKAQQAAHIEWLKEKARKQDAREEIARQKARELLGEHLKKSSF